MKFSEIPIGSSFNRLHENAYMKIEADLILDLSSFSFYNASSHWYTLDKQEFYLVYKCNNCKKYQESCTGQLNMISGNKQIILGEEMSVVYTRGKCPETFSCSLFEDKRQ